MVLGVLWDQGNPPAIIHVPLQEEGVGLGVDDNCEIATFKSCSGDQDLVSMPNPRRECVTEGLNPERLFGNNVDVAQHAFWCWYALRIFHDFLFDYIYKSHN